MYASAPKTAGRLERFPLIVTALALVTLALSAPAFAAGGIPPVPPENRVPVTICHAVNGDGETGNGYNVITLDASAVVRRGHTSHGGGLVDIIPPFTYYTLEGTGQNRVWVPHEFPGQGDASLIADSCGSSGPPTEECPDGDFNGPDEDGCGVPDDVCPNIDGPQTEVPPGMEVAGNGDCVVPPVEPGGGGEGPGSGTQEPGTSSGPDVTVAGEQASRSGVGAGQTAGAAGTPAAPSTVAAGVAPEPIGSDVAGLALGLVGSGLLLIICAGLLGLRNRRRGSQPT